MTSPFILRATFVTILQQYPTRVEIIYDALKNRVFVFRLMDGGLAGYDLATYPQELAQVDKLLKKQWNPLLADDARLEMAMGMPVSTSF